MGVRRVTVLRTAAGCNYQWDVKSPNGWIQ